MLTPLEMDILEKKVQDLQIKLYEAEDETSCLRAAIRRTLQENPEIFNQTQSPFWRLKKVCGYKEDAKIPSSNT